VEPSDPTKLLVSLFDNSPCYLGLPPPGARLTLAFTAVDGHNVQACRASRGCARCAAGQG